MFSLIKLDETKTDGEKKKQLRDHERLKIIKNLVMPVKLSPVKKKKKKKIMVFPGRSDGKESACNAGDQDSIPGWGRSPGEENGNPLQYFCLKNPTDREAWLQPMGSQRVGHD